MEISGIIVLLKLKLLLQKDVPSGCIAVGNPMKIIKIDVNWK